MPHIDNGPGSLNKLLELVYNQCIEQRGSQTEKDETVCSEVAWEVAKKHGWHQLSDGQWVMGTAKLTPDTNTLNDMGQLAPEEKPSWSFPQTPKDGPQGQVFEKSGIPEASYDHGIVAAPPAKDVGDYYIQPNYQGPEVSRQDASPDVPGGISDDKNPAQLSLFSEVDAVLKTYAGMTWGELHGKLMREGKSKEDADRICGAVKAKQG